MNVSLSPEHKAEIRKFIAGKIKLDAAEFAQGLAIEIVGVTDDLEDAYYRAQEYYRAIMDFIAAETAGRSQYVHLNADGTENPELTATYRQILDEQAVLNFPRQTGGL